MISKPGSKFEFVQFTTGKSQDQAYHFLFRRIDPQAIESEKEIHGLERHTLVAIDEGVVFRNPKTIGCSKTAKIRSRLILEPVPWPAERRVQKALVSEPGRSAVRFDLVSMHSENKRHREPTGLLHFASSRMALRYCLAPSA